MTSTNPIARVNSQINNRLYLQVGARLRDRARFGILFHVPGQLRGLIWAQTFEEINR